MVPYRPTEASSSDSSPKTLTYWASNQGTSLDNDKQVLGPELTKFTQQPAVWVVDPKERTVAIRNVDVLRFDQAQVIISQGLDTGEIIVTAGVQALHPGQKVRVLGSEP